MLWCSEPGKPSAGFSREEKREMGNGGSGEPTASPRPHTAVGQGATAAARAGRMVCVGELSRISGSAVPWVMETAVQGQPQHLQFVGWCSHSASVPPSWAQSHSCWEEPAQRPLVVLWSLQNSLAICPAAIAGMIMG